MARTLNLCGRLSKCFPSWSWVTLEGLGGQRLQGEVSEADIDKTIENLREQQTKFDPSGACSEIGDQVMIDYEGLRVASLLPVARPRIARCCWVRGR